MDRQFNRHVRPFKHLLSGPHIHEAMRPASDGLDHDASQGGGGCSPTWHADEVSV